MANSLILGMTESGKTTLAKRLCTRYRDNGTPTLVLDPMYDPEWEADIICRDVNEFLDVVWDLKQYAVFIDESGDCVGKFNKAMEKTATMGRHWGHNFHYLSQRGTQINKTVRDQCKFLFLFTTAIDDCDIHKKEWNKPQLANGYLLPQGTCYHCDKYNLFKTIKVF